MRPAPPQILSPHRVARLTAWARLWLIWFAGAFAALWSRGACAHAGWLDRAARIAAIIIVLNAAALMPPPRTPHRHGRKAGMNRRALIGAHLRRALRARTPVARLFAILTVMRDMSRHVARLMRRLRAGLTRLRVLLPSAEAPPRLNPPAFAQIACPDTS